MDVRVRYCGGKKFEINARNHSVISDQPPENAGADAGMTPPELFLGSLGACAGYYAAEYLRARGLTSEELEIRVTAEKGERPARLASFRIDVIAPGLSQKHQEGVLRAVNSCLLKNSLTAPPRIETRVLTSPEAAPEESSQVPASQEF